MIWPLITDYGRYEFQELHRWVGKQARANGFEVIDLLSEFSRVWNRELQVSAEDQETTLSIKAVMLQTDRKNSRSPSRTPVPVDRPVHRELRAVRRFAGNRQLQILSKPAFHPITFIRLPVVRSSQNEGSVWKCPPKRLGPQPGCRGVPWVVTGIGTRQPEC